VECLWLRAKGDESSQAKRRIERAWAEWWIEGQGTYLKRNVSSNCCSKCVIRCFDPMVSFKSPFFSVDRSI
jgi:hypothetical protein